MNIFKIKYGLNYEDSIDITNEVLEKYLNKEYNILKIDIDINILIKSIYSKKKNFIIIFNKYIKYFNIKFVNEYIIIDFNDIFKLQNYLIL